MMGTVSPLKISLPKNFLIVGSTQSGKTQFIKRLLLNADEVFTLPVERVIYCYGAWQPAYDELQAHFGDVISFRSDIPSKEELTEIWEEKGGETLLILDDKMTSLKDNLHGQAVLEIVSVISHHCHISCIIALQNIFHNKTVQEISLNSHCICLFRNNRSAQQIKTLAQQIMPMYTKYFMDSYEKATAEEYGYLLVDLSPGVNKKFQLRTAIFPNEDLIVYLPKK